MAGGLDPIEAAAVEAVAGSWSRSVEAFKRALLAAQARGPVTLADVHALAQRLDVTPPRLGHGQIVDLLRPAALVGDARVASTTEVAVAGAATAALANVGGKPAVAKAEMLTRASVLNLDTVTGLLGVLGPLGRSVNEMQGSASYAVHAAANEATASAARQAEQHYVFQPERDACLDCVALAGEVDGETPPVHPWCRCTVRPYDDPAVVAAIKREALRSTLRGFSLPSESEKARLRAAQAALRGRPAAPESVKRYAAASVRRGRFARGRGVPGIR